MNKQTLIVTFCNYEYVRIALNWITCLQTVNVYSYLIIATDEDAFDALLSEKVNVIYSPENYQKDQKPDGNGGCNLYQIY